MSSNSLCGLRLQFKQIVLILAVDVYSLNGLLSMMRIEVRITTL